jgi:hypothetical protein
LSHLARKAGQVPTPGVGDRLRGFALGLNLMLGDVLGESFGLGLPASSLFRVDSGLVQVPQPTTRSNAEARKPAAAAPLATDTVSPSMPEEALRAAFTAVASIDDSPALTLLIEALARLTSTSTTSSSLLSAGMGRTE